MFENQSCFVYVTLKSNGMRSAYATDEAWTESKYAYFKKEGRMVFSGVKRKDETLDEAIWRVENERNTVKGIVAPLIETPPLEAGP